MSDFLVGLVILLSFGKITQRRDAEIVLVAVTLLIIFGSISVAFFQTSIPPEQAGARSHSKEAIEARLQPKP